MQTECTPALFEFEPVEHKKVVAGFDGGPHFVGDHEGQPAPSLVLVDGLRAAQRVAPNRAPPHPVCQRDLVFQNAGLGAFDLVGAGLINVGGLGDRGEAGQGDAEGEKGGGGAECAIRGH